MSGFLEGFRSTVQHELGAAWSFINNTTHPQGKNAQGENAQGENAQGKNAAERELNQLGLQSGIGLYLRCIEKIGACAMDDRPEADKTANFMKRVARCVFIFAIPVFSAAAAFYNLYKCVRHLVSNQKDNALQHASYALLDLVIYSFVPKIVLLPIGIAFALNAEGTLEANRTVNQWAQDNIKMDKIQTLLNTGPGSHG